MKDDNKVAVSPSRPLMGSTAREIEVPNFCTCKTQEQDEHSCPFAEDIHGDDGTCFCCDYCTHQCAMDI